MCRILHKPFCVEYKLRVAFSPPRTAIQNKNLCDGIGCRGLFRLKAGVCPRLKNSPPDCFSPNCGRVAFSTPRIAVPKQKPPQRDRLQRFIMIKSGGLPPAKKQSPGLFFPRLRSGRLFDPSHRNSKTKTSAAGYAAEAFLLAKAYYFATKGFRVTLFVTAFDFCNRSRFCNRP